MAQGFAPGAVLGGRFELHGVVGRGGTAEVWLATDRLRSERVALKLVHPHLAADPDARRRLQREVQTASVLRSDAALVPHDLHELDGRLALSMPFHPGQTLAERVAAGGAMRPEDVRALGIRVASALADAHRAGVLHRDVTANNVLVGDRAEDSVLTDFGLARILGGTRSTGLLGTAGYAAPEVYAGQRADPRSDLYGLGAVLYLAITGRPPFDPRDPVRALKQQLDGTLPKVRDRVPGCPPDLADLVDRLLRADPDDRPQGARDVVDALVRRTVEPPTPARSAAPEPEVVTPLPEGRWTVVIHERSHDRPRRDRLRRKAIGVAPSAEDEFARWGQLLVNRIRDAVGMEPAGTLSPEDGLHLAVAELAGASPQSVRTSRVLLDRKFRLVDGTDQASAEHLANRARTLGFRADALEVVDRDPRAAGLRALWLAMMVGGWIAVVPAMEYVGLAAVAAMVMFTVFGAALFNREGSRVDRDLRRLSVAYPASLSGLLTTSAVVMKGEPAPKAVAAQKVAPVAAPTRGHALRERALAAIAGLEEVARRGELPDPARDDLLASAKQLRARADALAREVDRIEAALVDPDDSTDHAALRTRLERMEALERAGAAVDRRERERIERALAAHAADRDAADRLESELAAATAGLLELASTASRVRRELVAPETGAGTTADEVVRRLSVEAKAAVEARREAGGGESARDAVLRAARAGARRVER